MKHNRIYHYFGWLALSTLLLTTACAGISDLDVEKPKVSGPNTVTFTIQPQTMTGGMRAVGDIDTRNTVISRGDSANVLIYAVYKKQSNGSYAIDSRFGKGNKTKYENLVVSEDQTAIDVEKYPITLQFLIEDDGEYQVAFWAQNGETEAYDTQDLTKVEVKYKNAEGKNFLNNTENRDAFCAFSDEFSIVKKPKDVILRRPLAQVNVGTAGWDYEGAAVLRPGSVSYNQSTMTLKGVARYYNVLKDETLKQSELTSEDGKDTTDVTFGYYRLPAFINVDENEWKKPKIYPYYKKTSEEDSIRIEEFLTVDYVKDATDEDKDGIIPYKGWDFYNNYRQTDSGFLSDGTLPDTEQFKYLSMCYVLVPEAKTDETPEANTVQATNNGTEIEGEAYGSGSTVDVEFTFKGVERTDDGDGFGKDISFQQTYKVNNVPVKKNWRTNLLSQNIFTYSTTFKIDVVPQYMGNFNDDGTISGSWPKNHVIPNEGATYYSVDFKGGIATYKSNDNAKANSFFTCANNNNQFNTSNKRYGSWKYTSERTGTYSDDTGYGYKLSSGGSVKFETDSFAIVIVVCSEKTNLKDGTPTDCVRGISFDGKDYPLSTGVKNPDGCSGVYVYTIDGVAPGTHEIRQGLTVTKEVEKINEGGLFYVEVIYGELQLDGIDPDENFEYENPDE